MTNKTNKTNIKTMLSQEILTVNIIHDVFNATLELVFRQYGNKILMSRIIKY